MVIVICRNRIVDKKCLQRRKMKLRNGKDENLKRKIKLEAKNGQREMCYGE